MQERHSDSVYRSCSRCRAELTDAASRECGVGPICRKKDNAIFARQIPANLNTATVLVLALKPENFHADVAGDLENIKTSYFRKMEALQRANEDLTRVTLRGADFRKMIDWLDRGLSYPCPRGTRERVIELVEALGYAALGGVLRGDVCMSPAILKVEGTSITLSGKASKDGWRAMRRSIPGVVVPRYRGDKTPYRASVIHAEKFVEIALRYWPFVDTNTDIPALLAEAKTAAATVAVSVPVIAGPVAPEASVRSYMAHFITGLKPWIAVTTPWHGTRAEMTAMLDAFKTIRERRYDVVTKTWHFAAEHTEAVKAIVGARYRVVCS